MAAINAEELASFVEKATSVHDTVKQLMADPSPKALKNADALIKELNDGKEMESEPESVLESVLDYRSGNGWNTDYKWFCGQCKIEILIHTQTCPKCNDSQSLQSQSDRKQTLQSRVDALKYEYERKQTKRTQWENYRKLHPKNSRLGSTYEEWEMWQPQIDLDEYTDDSFMPDLPEMRAMAVDMKERAAKRADQMKLAIKEKQIGNGYMAKKQYATAIQHYTIGIDYRKDFKPLYTNRALAYLKTDQCNKCIQDCDTVIEIVEVFDKEAINSDIVFKAYLRRANAFRLLENFDSAESDILLCLKMRPRHKEAMKLRSDIAKLSKGQKSRRDIQSKLSKNKSQSQLNNATFRMITDALNDVSNRGVLNSAVLRQINNAIRAMEIDESITVQFADSNGIKSCLDYINRQLRSFQSKYKSKNGINKYSDWNVANLSKVRTELKNATMNDESEAKRALESDSKSEIDDILVSTVHNNKARRGKGINWAVESTIRVFMLLTASVRSNANILVLNGSQYTSIVGSIVFYCCDLIPMLSVDLKYECLRFSAIALRSKRVNEWFTQSHSVLLLQIIVDHFNNDWKYTNKQFSIKCLEQICSVLESVAMSPRFKVLLTKQTRPQLINLLLDNLQTYAQWNGIDSIENVSLVSHLFDNLASLFVNPKLSALFFKQSSKLYCAKMDIAIAYFCKLTTAFNVSVARQQLPTVVNQILKTMTVFVSVSPHNCAQTLLLDSILSEMCRLLSSINDQLSSRSASADVESPLLGLLHCIQNNIFLCLDKLAINPNFDSRLNAYYQSHKDSDFWRIVIKNLVNNPTKTSLNDDTSNVKIQIGCAARIVLRKLQKQISDLKQSQTKPLLDGSLPKLLIESYLNELLIGLNQSDEIAANVALIVRYLIEYCKLTQNQQFKQSIVGAITPQLESVMNLLRSDNKTVRKNGCVLMGQIAGFDSVLMDKVRAIGGMKALLQLSSEIH